MDGLTIHEAAQATGWSPRMLRYLDRIGLVEPARTAAGYRIYRQADLRRLRALRGLLGEFGCGLAEIAFAKRIREDARLRTALAAWFDASPGRPAGAPCEQWLAFEQEKHQRLLAA